MSSVKSSTSGNLMTRRTLDADDSINDADEFEEDIPTKKGRGMSMEYSIIEKFTDYSLAQKYMSETLSTYKFRYNKETEDGRKAYYYCKGYLKCNETVFILLVSLI